MEVLGPGWCPEDGEADKLKRLLLLITIVVLLSTILYGCNSRQNKPVGNSITPAEQTTSATQPTAASQEGKDTLIDKSPSRKSNYIVDDGEIAGYLSYDYQSRMMNIAGLKVFEELSTRNEGGVSISDDNNVLFFYMVKCAGTITGACDGPYVQFKVDLAANKIMEKEFRPGPDFAAAGRPEYADHSNEVIELTDERMIEIGKYFKNLIMEIEAN